MDRFTRRILFAAALMLAGGTFAAPRADAAVFSLGRHRACRDHVAVREYPGGPARDNLDKGQTFVVERDDGGEYVHGYKLVNGVHGWVLRSSIDRNC